MRYRTSFKEFICIGTQADVLYPSCTLRTQLIPPQLELVVESEDGLASSTDLLHVVSSLQRKLSYKDAQAFLRVLAGDKWLDEVVG